MKMIGSFENVQDEAFLIDFITLTASVIRNLLINGAFFW